MPIPQVVASRHEFIMTRLRDARKALAHAIANEADAVHLAELAVRAAGLATEDRLYQSVISSRSWEKAVTHAVQLAMARNRSESPMDLAISEVVREHARSWLRANRAAIIADTNPAYRDTNTTLQWFDHAILTI